MAIYPLQSNYIIDVDIITTTAFKAGMVLMRDDNGRAIPADNSTLLYKTIYQKAGKHLGFASSDHDVSGLTIVEPDVVGSSWLDSNRTFQRYENSDIVHSRRFIAEHLDPSYDVSNPSNRSVVAKRGIGVYNQPGELYSTDQFIPVLHGDFGQDFTDIQTINPGDLLTVGSGVNAGKMVKVNVNSIGTDIIVVGVVDRYDTNSGLLYFRQVSYNLSFGTASSTVFALDAASAVSYPGSGTVWYDLSGNARNFTLTNGPTFSNTNFGLISFDGTNDYAGLTYTLPNNTITVMVWYYSGSFSTQGDLDSLIANDGPTNNGFDIRRRTGNTFQLIDWFNSSATLVVATIGSIADNSWYLVVYTYDGSRYKTYLNNTKTNDAAVTGPRNTIAQVIHIANEPFFGSGGTRALGGYVSEVRILNKALTDTELSAYYNSTKGRYGL